DGTGTTDLLYVGTRGAVLYLNEVGNSWSEGRPLRAVPTVDSSAQVSFVDLLGTGTACIVWSSPLPGASSPMRYIDLLGGTKPHLLHAISNNLGLETRVLYAPSTQFYLQDKREGKAWATRLPFPVHVVSRVEQVDHVQGTRLVTQYRYRHGYFEGTER